MAYHNLLDLIDVLESKNQLFRITEYINPELEVTEINDRIIKHNSKALLFENNGTEFPLLVNVFGSEERINTIFEIENLDDIGKRIQNIVQKISKPNQTFKDKLMMLPLLKEISSWMPNRSSGRAKCQSEMMTVPDLSKLPILKCWPFDGGKFITLPMVITQNPETGILNTGMYRMQVIDNCTTAMHWHLHKDGAKHYQMYKKMGKIMPVSVAIGGDPILSYCASAPLPENIDEFMLAGFLRNEKVRLIKCKTNELYVPADADFILEGYIDPSEDLILEGPFGDHTGYYSLSDYYPKFHITCITYRTDAIYPATIVGVPPQEDRWLGKATERIFLNPIRLTISPDIIDINLPYQGGFHNLAIVKINNRFNGHAFSIMNALWGAGQMMFNKIMIVVDENTDIYDYKAVLLKLSKIELNNDILLTKGAADVLDHSGRKFAFSGKIGINATQTNNNLKNGEFDSQKFIYDYPNITFNEKLVFENGFLILGIDKNNIQNTKIQVVDIINKEYIKNINFLILFDYTVNLESFDIMLWQLSGNIDPIEDCYFVNNNTVMVIDATAKRSSDNFNRNWPNVITMDEITIKNIDKKWNTLNIGDFIESPSNSLKSMVSNEGAVAIKGKNY